MNLRPMTFEDADFLLELKNYPETRQFAIVTHNEISKESHLKYLEDNIQYFQVACAPFGGKEGIVRIKDNEISIWISRESWGHGLASWLLEMVSEKGMTAKIVNGNIGSFRAFINAGFKPIDYKENYYILQK